MRNPLTFQVESYIGATFVFLFTGFCVALIFIINKNFDTDLSVQASQDFHIRRISPTEKHAIDIWMRSNGISIPTGEGYGWILTQYPSRPWDQ